MLGTNFIGPDVFWHGWPKGKDKPRLGESRLGTVDKPDSFPEHGTATLDPYYGYNYSEDGKGDQELPGDNVDEVVTDEGGDDTTTPPDDTGGDGGGAPPPASTGDVPDYSGEAAGIKGSGDMSYEVPEAEDVETPMSSGTADPTQTEWEVTKEQTVAGQFEDLYNRDSPIFELARQRAIRQHLGSGGQNSAMAAGFGEVAAMDKAFQMAQQDAATYARSAEFNANMANQYSLAEQRFIHNAMLSDQAFEQAKSLQTQRIAAQFESIVLDYKGRSMLMDKELDQWFLKAKQEFAYDMGKLKFQLGAEKELFHMQALSNFYVNGVNSVLQIAGNPNLSAKQSKAAMEQGMIWFNNQLDVYRSLLGSMGGQSSSQNFANYNWTTGSTGNAGSIPLDENGYPDWSQIYGGAGR